jgi:hypothetical protein
MGGFFLTNVEADLDGAFTVQGHFMGCESRDTHQLIRDVLGPGQVNLHICSSTPCMDMSADDRAGPALHVTLLRLWQHRNFEADYVDAHVEESMKECVAAVEKRERAKRKTRKGKDVPEKPARAPRPGESKAKPKPGATKEKKKKVTEEEKEKEITNDQKLKLRERLKDVRKAHHAALGGATVTHHVPSGSEEDGPDGEEDASTDYAPTEPLDTGTKLKKRDRGRALKDHEKSRGAIVPYKGTKEATMKISHPLKCMKRGGYPGIFHTFPGPPPL